MSRPQESGYMQATYKKRKHLKTYHLIPQLATNNTCVWFNGDLLHNIINYFDTTVYIQQSFSVVQKKPVYKTFRRLRC